MIETHTLWTVIFGLGIGSFLLRFAFLGFVGDRPLPEWLLRHLRYTAVAILPAMCGPLVVYSGADGSMDPTRVIAAAVTLGAGIVTRNTLVAIGAGAVALAIAVVLLG